ncbi:endothelial cell-specific molecule 1-like [Ixodes scapularis]
MKTALVLMLVVVVVNVGVLSNSPLNCKEVDCDEVVCSSATCSCGSHKSECGCCDICNKCPGETCITIHDDLCQEGYECKLKDPAGTSHKVPPDGWDWFTQAYGGMWWLKREGRWTPAVVSVLGCLVIGVWLVEGLVPSEPVEVVEGRIGEAVVLGRPECPPQAFIQRCYTRDYKTKNEDDSMLVCAGWSFDNMHPGNKYTGLPYLL